MINGRVDGGEGRVEKWSGWAFQFRGIGLILKLERKMEITIPDPPIFSISIVGG